MGLREAIRAKGLQQRDVAIRAGVSQSTVSHWCARRHVIPAEKAMILHRDMGIPLEAMRPDLWKAAPQPEAIR